MVTTALTAEQFKNTSPGKMIKLSATAESTVDIWPYVQDLVLDALVPDYVFMHHLVEHVYRSEDLKYDHVLLATADENLFLVIVVDRSNARILGHHQLDTRKGFGHNETSS